MNNLEYTPNIIRDNVIDDIKSIEGDNLVEKIISYCDKNDIDPQEIGDLLSENKIFKQELLIDCVKNNIIKDKRIKDKLNTLEEW